MENLKTLLGKKIRERRKELGFSTQESLVNAISKASGYKIDVDQSRVSRWEKGHNKPDDVYQKLLCEVLKVSKNFFDDIEIVKTAVYKVPTGSTTSTASYTITKDQLIAISEEAATKGVKAAMDAINKPTVSKQDTKSLSEKDKLILEITSGLPLLDVNNLKVIRDRVLRKSPSLRSKKSVNS